LSCGDTQHPFNQIGFEFRDSQIQIGFGYQTLVYQFRHGLGLHLGLLFREAYHLELFNIGVRIQNCATHNSILSRCRAAYPSSGANESGWQAHGKQF
jgi:hypothetical protein